MVLALLALLVVPAIASANVVQRGGATAGTTTSGTLAIGKPAGVVAGDLMIATVAKNTDASAPSASGWTLVSGADLGGVWQRHGAVLYRVATAADASVTSYAFALGTGTTDAVGGIIAFSGVDSATPFDVAPGAIRVNSTSATVTANGLTTARANAAVVMLGMASRTAPTWSAWTTASPGALTELLDAHSASDTVGAAWAAKATTGATGNGTASLSGPQRNGGLLLALRPAPLVPLTVSATGVDKTYDRTTSATVTLSSSDVRAGDTVTFAHTGAAFASAAAGTDKTVSVSGISISGRDAPKYSLQNTTATTTACITKADLGVTATNQSKTYGDVKALGDTAFTTSGLVTGDSVDTVTLHSDGAAADAAVSGSPYAIIPSAATGTGLDNYDITYTDGSLTVDPRGLTITAGDRHKAYGDAFDLGTTAFTADGLVNSDEVTGVTLTSSGADATAPVTTLPYPIGASDAQGSGLANYTIDYVDGGLTVDPKGLTIVGAVAQNKVYDGAENAIVDYSSATLDGVVFLAEDVDFDPTPSTASFAAKTVQDDKPVTVDGVILTGGAAGNYTLSQPAGLTADITALGVAGSFATQGKTYDGNADAVVLTRDVSGALTRDDVALTGGTAAFDDKNVGDPKTVTLTGAGLEGADAGNYTLDSVATTTAAITAKDLTVAATGVDKVYDGTTDATVTLDSTDVVIGDAVSMDSASATFADKNVANGVGIAVGGISISGTDAGNYALLNTTADTVANITPLGVTGGFTAQDKVYDGNADAVVLTRVVNGAVAGDDVTLTGGSAAFDDANVGPAKTVTLSGSDIALSGTTAGNYALDSVATTTAAITAKELTVTGAVANGKVYDGTTEATVDFTAATLDGVVGTEVVGLDSSAYTAAFAAKDADTGVTVTVDGLALVGTADPGNYALTQPALSADIAPAPLTVTATGHNKVYDGTTTADVTLHTVDVVTGDIVAPHRTGATFADKNVGGSVAIAVDGISIGGADAGNYDLRSTTAAAQASITPKALAIAAGDQAKQYGQAFGFTGKEFTASGLVSGDTVETVTLTCAGADAAAVAGAYPITASAAVGTGLGNYAVAYTDGTMTVTGGGAVTTYRFSAFAKPLGAKDKKKFRVGTKVLVKFTITDDKGALVTTLSPKVGVSAKGFKFGPKTARYNAKKNAYTYTLKIGKSWKLRGYNLTTTLAGSAAKGKVKFKVVR